MPLVPSHRRPLLVCFLIRSLVLSLVVLVSDLHAEPTDTSLIALGQKLFSNPRLSRDGTIACISCHQPSKAYADGRPTAIGIGRQHGTRNTPSLLTTARQAALFWDGRRESLEDLVLDPVINPVEMGMNNERDVVARISADRALSAVFKRTFPQSEPAITPKHVRTALAAFLRSLDTGESAYDRFQEDSSRFPLELDAQKGLTLFRGKAGCSGCHRVEGSPASLTDNTYHHTGVGWQRIEHDLPSLTRAVLSENVNVETLGRRVTADPKWAALGRFVVTHKPTDIGAFRTPSLRNVVVTAPYMHDGSVATLAEAVDIEIYYRSLTAGKPLILTADERRALIEFLQMLTDRP